MRRLVTATLAAAFALTAPIALAQDKKADKGGPKATMKVIAENAKVRAYEVTFAPGAENTSVPASSTRVVRALEGGTLERTYTESRVHHEEHRQERDQALRRAGQVAGRNTACCSTMQSGANRRTFASVPRSCT